MKTSAANESSSTFFEVPTDLKPHQDNKESQSTLGTVGTRKSEPFGKAGSGCVPPFQEVGSSCYYFGSALLNFADAKSYCESLTHGHPLQISLAMLDFSKENDQELLDAVSTNQNPFWLGGSTDDDGTWKWVDNRNINIFAPFWNDGSPNVDGNNCTIVQSYNYIDDLYRSYLYDHNCAEQLNFICQTGCPVDFTSINNHCYLRSWDFGVPVLTWLEARDYCASLVVPEGYHADLAVIGITDQDDYSIMNNLVRNYTGETFIGAFQETNCNYKWIDERELPLQSIYWRDTEPDCGDYNRVSMYSDGIHRPYLRTLTDAVARQFICQIFKDI